MVTAVMATISLVFMISGIVLKNGVLLLASSLSWVIFAFLMFSHTFDNAAIGEGLLVFGGIMAAISAILALGIWNAFRAPKSSESDYESYRKKVMNATRKR